MVILSSWDERTRPKSCFRVSGVLGELSMLSLTNAEAVKESIVLFAAARQTLIGPLCSLAEALDSHTRPD